MIAALLTGLGSPVLDVQTIAAFLSERLALLFSVSVHQDVMFHSTHVVLELLEQHLN